MSNNIIKVNDFIRNHIDQIDDNNFEGLYEWAKRELGSATSLLTTTLLSAGIEPLNYLDYIPQFYLWWANNIIDEIEIPSHINSIHQNAFGATAIKSLIIPGNIKIIGKNAFAHCNYLINIEIQEGVHTIYDYAFNNCNHIESVSLPNSIKSLGNDLFSYNQPLIHINYNGTERDWLMISKSKDLFLKSTAEITGIDFIKRSHII